MLTNCLFSVCYILCFSAISITIRWYAITVKWYAITVRWYAITVRLCHPFYLSMYSVCALINVLVSYAFVLTVIHSPVATPRIISESYLLLSSSTLTTTIVIIISLAYNNRLFSLMSLCSVIVTIISYDLNQILVDVINGFVVSIRSVVTNMPSFL